MPPSPSSSSPKRSARSDSACTQLSTGIGSLYVNRCCCDSTEDIPVSLT